MTHRTGRRPGRSTTRADILHAAAVAFGEHGFDATTIRGIARRADVDPALVHHYFASKEEVFGHVVDGLIDAGPVIQRVLREPEDGRGERLVQAFLEHWEEHDRRPALLAVLRSVSTNEHAAVIVSDCVRSSLEGHAEADPGHFSPLRGSLVGSHLLGLAMLRYVLYVEPMARVSVPELAAAAGPTLDRYLAGPLPVAASAAASLARSVDPTNPGSCTKK